MPADDDVGLEDEPLRHEIDLLGESMAAKPAPRIVSTMRRSMTRKGRGRAP